MQNFFGPILDIIPKSEVHKLLTDSFFSPGHYGSQMRPTDQDDLVDREWFIREVRLEGLVAPARWNELVEWLNSEEDKWGKTRIQALLHPIIMGPDWATAQGQEAVIAGYSILDGWHRTALAVRSGHTTIKAIVGELDLDYTPE